MSPRTWIHMQRDYYQSKPAEWELQFTEGCWVLVNRERTLGFRKRILTQEGSTCTLLKGHFLSIWLQTKIGLLKRSFIRREIGVRQSDNRKTSAFYFGGLPTCKWKCSTFFFKWTWKQMITMEAICRYDLGAEQKGWQGNDLL